MRTSTALLSVAFASLASANIYVTNPVTSTTCTPGTSCLVQWADDGNAPFLATIGVCSIAVCTGGNIAQTCLQTISASTDVSQNAQVSFVPDSTIGPSATDLYFIKFTALTYKSASNPAEPFTAFSSKFSLAGMTGTFNATIQAEISQSAEVVATTAAAATTTAAAAGITTITTGASKATTAAKTTATTSKKSGAVPMVVPGVMASFVGVTVAVSLASVFLGRLALGV